MVLRKKLTYAAPCIHGNGLENLYSLWSSSLTCVLSSRPEYTLRSHEEKAIPSEHSCFSLVDWALTPEKAIHQREISIATVTQLADNFRWGLPWKPGTLSTREAGTFYFPPSKAVLGMYQSSIPCPCLNWTSTISYLP